MKKLPSSNYWLLVGLLLMLGIGMRLLPHPPNFSPIAALAMFGALYLPKKWSIVLPLGALMVSDFFIGFYSGSIMMAVYVSFMMVGLIGLWVKQHKNLVNIVSGTLAGSLLFFLITNGAVWAFSGMYALDFAGLIRSYELALPFFRNTLAGDLFFVGLLVGSMELAMVKMPRKIQTSKSEI